MKCLFLLVFMRWLLQLASSLSTCRNVTKNGTYNNINVVSASFAFIYPYLSFHFHNDILLFHAPLKNVRKLSVQTTNLCSFSWRSVSIVMRPPSQKLRVDAVTSASALVLHYLPSLHRFRLGHRAILSRTEHPGPSDQRISVPVRFAEISLLPSCPVLVEALAFPAVPLPLPRPSAHFPPRPS